MFTQVPPRWQGLCVLQWSERWAQWEEEGSLSQTIGAKSIPEPTCLVFWPCFQAFVYPHAKWGYPLPELLPLEGGPRIPGV